MSERGKHTPGPWTVDPDHANLTAFAVREDVPVVGVVEAAGFVVCAVWGDGMWRDNPAEFKANARLIAAAPELLEALRDLREAATEAYKAGRIVAEPFVRAGNVLAKAEGK